MIKKFRKHLIVGIAIVMVLSAMAVLVSGFYGTNQNGLAANPYQQGFVKSMSTGAPVQMTTENMSAVQSQISNYNYLPMSGDQSLNFLVNFKPSNLSRLSSYIALENDPLSASYHKFLKSSDFAPGAAYGPSRTVYNDVLNYYSSMGFNVVKSYSQGIEFSGSVSQVNKAFNTTMVSFAVSGSQKYANIRPISVPSAIAGSISSIDGLSNLLSYKPDSMVAPASQTGSGSMNGITSNAVTNYLSQSNVLNFSRHSFAWANVPGYGLTQFLFPTTMPLLYNATDLIKNGYNGKNVTIAVVMGQGYNPSDLQTYAQEAFNNPYQITNRITNYPVYGATNASANGTVYWNYTAGLAGEFTLDIEYSSTMAPGAHIDAVYGPDLSTISLDSAYLQILNIPNTPQIVTNSWGGDEDIWWNLYGPGFQNANSMNIFIEELTSMGSSVFFSSGDSAGVGYYTNFLTPSFGATSPYVVGVGGVRTVANSASGPYPTGNVSNFTLAPYSNQPANGGFWYPSYPLNVANATGIYNQSFWYTPSSSGVPYAGGQVGLSYWFNQSTYQHGPGIPSIGRQNTVTISAEGDFNETEYYAGMWVFFWGGTSFACPTTAGEFADILSYFNQTTGNPPTVGWLTSVIYEVGNFQDKLPLSPFNSILYGSDPWAAANQNMGWPNDLAYPAGWTQEHSGYTYLTGWGTVNAYNFAHDVVLGQSTFTTFLANFSLPGTIVASGAANNIALDSGTLYNFTVFGTVPSPAPVPGAIVNITVYASSGNGTIVGYDNATADLNGGITFDTTGFGGDTATIKITNLTGVVSYWYVYINATLTSGTLNVTVLQSSVMGGFSWYDAYGIFTYPDYYPALAPLMPNTVEVRVTLNNVPVSGAYVQATDLNFYPFEVSTNGTLTLSPMASAGFTNASGIAFVETWNVPDNTTYGVTAFYEGLSNQTTFNVTPQYFVVPNENNINLVLGTYYSGVLELPAVTPGTSYTIQLRTTNYNTTFAEQTLVSVGEAMTYPGSTVLNMMAPVMTSSQGLFNLTINDSYAPGLYFVNVTNPNGQFTTYNGIPMNVPSTYMPLLITGNVGASFLPLSPDQSISSPYAGTGWTMSGEIVDQYTMPIFGFGGYISGDMSSGPSYWFDNQAKQTYAVGTDPNTNPQTVLAADIPIPTDLPMGLNTFNVQFNDTLYNLNYTYTLDFYIISSNSSTTPSATLAINGAQSPHIVSSSQTYYTGTVKFSLTNNQTAYTTSTIEITNTQGTTVVDLTYDVTGDTTFSYNFANLAPGSYTVTYTVTNPNGFSASSLVILNVQFAYSVTFTESGLASGTSWSVVFNNNTYNSTTSSITVSNVLGGTYNYSVSNVTGYVSPGSSSLNVNGNSNVNIAFGKTAGALGTSSILYIIGGTIAGLVVGGVVVYFLARRPKP